MPRAGKAKTLAAPTESHRVSLYEVNTVEDLETHDILDSALLTAMGFTPTVDQFLNDYRVIRVPLLTADVANEAAADVGVLVVARNAAGTGFTVTFGAAATGLVADTKFIRLRVIDA